MVIGLRMAIMYAEHRIKPLGTNTSVEDKTEEFETCMSCHYNCIDSVPGVKCNSFFMICVSKTRNGAFFIINVSSSNISGYLVLGFLAAFRIFYILYLYLLLMFNLSIFLVVLPSSSLFNVVLAFFRLLYTLVYVLIG